jgi:hypothetical protein
MIVRMSVVLFPALSSAMVVIKLEPDVSAALKTNVPSCETSIDWPFTVNDFNPEIESVTEPTIVNVGWLV